jgi:hypothetical protein
LSLWDVRVVRRNLCLRVEHDLIGALHESAYGFLMIASRHSANFLTLGPGYLILEVGHKLAVAGKINHSLGGIGLLVG